MTMRNGIYLAFIIMALLPQNSFAQEAKEIPLGSIGSFHGDEISFENNQNVSVLLREGNDFVFKKDQVIISLYEDAIIDNQGEATGKAVSLLSGKDDAEVFLIFGRDDFQEGRVLSAALNPNCMENVIKDDGECVLNFGEENIRMSLLNKMPVDSDDMQKPYVYDLKVVSEGNETTFPRVDSILFVGDLDRDGRADFIIDTAAHYNAWIGIDVYLSSYAKEGELVGFAGRLEGLGC